MEEKFFLLLRPPPVIVGKLEFVKSLLINNFFLPTNLPRQESFLVIGEWKFYKKFLFADIFSEESFLPLVSGSL